MHLRRVLLIGAVLPLAACTRYFDGPLDDPSGLLTEPVVATTPVRPTQTIYIGQDQRVDFTAVAGDTIIVIMNDSSDAEIAVCQNMGGEPIFNPYTGILECDGVDF